MTVHIAPLILLILLLNTYHILLIFTITILILVKYHLNPFIQFYILSILLVFYTVVKHTSIRLFFIRKTFLQMVDIPFINLILNLINLLLILILILTIGLINKNILTTTKITILQYISCSLPTLHTNSLSLIFQKPLIR